MTFGTVGVDVLILGGGAHIPTHANNSQTQDVPPPTTPQFRNPREFHNVLGGVCVACAALDQRAHNRSMPMTITSPGQMRSSPNIV